eukprot:gnl/Trimastix_PCT/1441.p1 GENE.gnl/Trimastix_PCT/1441~~gnl/Trimastix_PCT/1441.p1  ORF type:complete len:169 (+),score=32.03 gnl/Trimastix_PCT/1441:239-745(+)
MAKYLEHMPDSEIVGKRIIELGSGTGIVGIVASWRGADVISTDRPDVVPFLQRNISRNTDATHKIRVVPYSWGTDASGLPYFPGDLIIGSDITYYDDLYEILLDSMQQLIQPSNTMLLSFWRTRKDYGPLLQMLHDRFHLEEVPMSEHHPDFRTDQVTILRITCKIPE